MSKEYIFSQDEFFQERVRSVESLPDNERYPYSFKNTVPIGELNKNLSILKGRGTYNPSRLQIFLPSEYVVNILKNSDIIDKLFGNCSLEIDSMARSPYLKQN